jgi:hypothetical protein
MCWLLAYIAANAWLTGRYCAEESWLVQVWSIFVALPIVLYWAGVGAVRSWRAR